MGGTSSTVSLVGMKVDPFFAEANNVRNSPNPKPEQLQKLVNDAQANATSVYIGTGRNRQNYRLVIMAGLIKQLIDKGVFNECKKPEEPGNNDEYWVYLFKKAQGKYAGYWNTVDFFGTTLQEVTVPKSGENTDGLLNRLESQIKKDFYPECQSRPVQGGGRRYRRKTRKSSDKMRKTRRKNSV